MPITYRIDLEQRLVRTTASGTIGDGDLREHEDRLAADPAFEPSMVQLVDGRSIERLQVSTQGIRDFVKAESNRHGDRFARHRVAIVAPADVVYGMSRMYQTMSDVTVGVFRSMGEAMSFLGLASSTS